jgi:energy-coupling factor transport system ATP-binding protein
LVLRNLQTDFAAGKVHSIVGGNASGKSTLLGLIAGLHKPQRGRVSVAKDLRVSVLPQSPQASFITDAVRDELCTPLAGTNWRAHSDSRAATNKDLALRVAQDLGIDHLLDQHPYDLSGGEAQKLALAKVLLVKPDILLLDEPTKGLDACARRELGELFLSLANQGKTLVVVTHDLSFAAQYSDTCSLLANGELMARDLTRNFFRGNSFYTTPTYRMTRKIIKDCVTPLEAIAELSSVKSAK